MDLAALLRQQEGKRLEFKRDLSSPAPILRTLVAFANTAGGVLVIGVEDKTHDVRGVSDPMAVEERLANLLSDSIAPRPMGRHLRPSQEAEFSTWLARQLKTRINQRIVLTREAEIQPRLGADPAEEIDLLCTVITEETQITVPIEVKCNWNSGVVTALTNQLGDRYLAGPTGNEGIYIVGCFSGATWDKTDKRRHAVR